MSTIYETDCVCETRLAPMHVLVVVTRLLCSCLREVQEERWEEGKHQQDFSIHLNQGHSAEAMNVLPGE